MKLNFDRIVKNGDGNSLLLAAIIGGALANAIPTICDPIYFNRVSRMKREYQQGKRTAESYQWHLVGEYYLWTTTFYLGLGTILLMSNNKYENNIKLLLGLLGAGAVVGFTVKNVQKDKELEALKNTAR
jgi:rhamnogalacturonyl hydrolase YesR